MAIPKEELEVIIDDLKRMIFSGVTSMSIDGRSYNSFSSMKELKQALAMAQADLAKLNEQPKKKVPIRNINMGAGQGSLYNNGY